MRVSYWLKVLLPHLGLLISALALFYGMLTLLAGLGINLPGWGGLAALMLIGLGAGLCLVGLVTLGFSWSYVDAWAKALFLMGMASLMVTGLTYDSAQKKEEYPEKWVPLNRGWFADYRSSGECPDITGIYDIGNANILTNTFLGRARKSYRSEFDAVVSTGRARYAKQIKWDTMKVTGDANKSLTITMVRDRSRQLDYQILDDPTKTFVRKKDVEYRCPSGWLYSYTAYEQDDVYFALDKQGNLVAKVINHKTKRTRWQHWLAVSERNFQTVLSSVEPPEPKYIKKPVIAKPSVETKALALAIKTKLTALSPSGVKVVGIRHDKAQFMVKVVADSKQAIAELMQSTKATYPDSEPVLKTNRKNTSTVYAEIMVAKDGFK